MKKQPEHARVLRAKRYKKKGRIIVNRGVKRKPKQVTQYSGKTQSLMQEARKYKTAEEFVKAQGNPLYHGTNADFTEFDKNKIGQNFSGKYGKGFYFANHISAVIEYGKNIIEAYLSLKNPVKYRYKYFYDAQMAGMDSTEYLKSLGYDGMIIGDPPSTIQYVAFYPEQIKTKSQLTDIWNKAHKTK